jgi:hypothetical protein
MFIVKTYQQVWDTKGVIDSVLALRAIDRGFESWSDQAKDYKISICYFSAKKGGV